MSVSVIPSHLSEVSKRVVPINSVHFLQTKKQTKKGECIIIKKP